ncbi:MFS transporter [Vibrio genomosp. F10]|uniref:MFS transporter n=1 Tax=Vibrio genomosp. F10 str. ZF-129 TaxID=1187848 RepID=A0A1E5BHV1_9VIBR|nr:MFS transporter [Vibrio genomosp. F10]OEE35849.1 MFS transporter [Vibrio genomosp. F10 str. ZF-129]OEF03841.1 MFS transporter [Vibrio genomosp. F10 str. 9ZB36]
MENILTTEPKARISVPVIALSLYAIASGYLMSLMPLMLPHYGLESSLASWLASVFYAGLLIGAIAIEPMVVKLGHRNAFISCLLIFMVSIVVLPVLSYSSIWLGARFVAGIAVAGVFVIVESWLLHGDESSRGKRLGLYMGALYGGSSLGQLGIGYIGVNGSVPYIAIFSLLSLAIMVLIFGKSEQPESEEASRLSIRQIAKLNHAAIMGCIVSGLVLGAVYGLMPLELSHRGIGNSEIGSLMALVILGGMAVQPTVPWLSKYLGRTLLMAMFCLLGVTAMALSAMSTDMGTFAVCLFILGMASFALYPIAINLGCDGLDANYIVSATQVMLFSYSIGSILGPVLADWFMQSQYGLIGYLFVALLSTCLYMLFASMKGKRQIMAGE